MASGIFAILDDIAALMDDVAIASKIATKKTAGILGDDLAVNAEKATGFLSSREIPVLWAITKGSFLNKLIIVPIALLLNFFFPVAIKFILILGGCYLAFEGAEKIIHYIFHKKKETEPEVGTQIDNEKAEKAKIKSAILTDFILSVEIVIIALGTVIERDASITVQIISVSVVAFLATVGVYGVVALIVRMDDAGYKIIKKSNNKGFVAQLGHFLVKALPYVIRILAFVGTIALLLVSGGIFSHNIDFFHHLLPNLNSTIKEFSLGLIIGFIVLAVVMITQKAYKLAVKK
ncbi:DUF808 domain-containing protein [Flavobacterium sp. I3-2]|uniref:DUF808 domain-containing protein n=1 Tax=Flavobacterium sp. I3-2 TaxID=2748319 RepID=UPI0015B25FE5|nr:DUF808 domain-containing protein [Flavobacterium sp. I3-2]